MVIEADRLLTAKEVERMLAVGHKKFYTMLRNGEFPAAFYLGPSSPRWRLSTVMDWINEKAS